MNSAALNSVSNRVCAKRRNGLCEIALVLVSAGAYSLLCFLAPILPHVAFANAREILALEDALGINMELGVNLWLDAHPAVGNIAAIYYSLSFFALTCAALAIVWKKRPERYGFARTSLFLMTGGAALTYWTYPLAPPRLMPELGYVDAVATHSTVGLGYTHFAQALANPYGAMPSMHTGWALWSALVLAFFVWTKWWQRLLLFLHPILTILVIIATGNHYLLDAVAGIAYCIVAMILASALTALRPLFSQLLSRARKRATDAPARTPQRPR